jgi:hypothetical protein
MPAVTGPWTPRTNAPNASVAFGTTRGEIFVTAGAWIGATYNFVELTVEMPAPDGAGAVNVRLEQPLHLNQAFATAFGLYGYESAALDLSITASEGARSTSVLQELVHAESVVIVPSAPDISGSDWAFPGDHQPLFFERPATTPGSVKVGVKVEAFAGGGGFFFTGSGCRFDAIIQGMTVEWLWL